MSPALPGGRPGRLLAALAGLVLLGGLAAGLARGERSQKGNLIVILDGHLAPLALPRDRPAPVAVHLEGGLRTADRGVLPRVTRIELGLPAEGRISTRGLPVCSPHRIRNAKPPEALSACGDALVGHGRLESRVLLPNHPPFTIEARLLAFNGRTAGRREVILHAYAADPPSVAVIPMRLRREGGRFGFSLVADLPPALGPWPRFADFEMTLARRYFYRGARHSYLSSSCPVPPRLTAGFTSLARVELTLAGGPRIAEEITRGCRAR